MTCITNSKCNRVTSLLCYLNMSPQTLPAGSPRFPQVNPVRRDGAGPGPPHPKSYGAVWLAARACFSQPYSISGNQFLHQWCKSCQGGCLTITVASVPSRAACAPLRSTGLTHRPQEHGIRLETSTLVVQGKGTFSDSKMISSSEGDPLSHSKGPSPKLVGVGGGKLPSVISRLLHICICVYIHRYIGR